MNRLLQRDTPPLTSRVEQLRMNLPQIALVTLLSLTFMLGGSAKGGLAFTAATQAAAGLALGVAAITLRWRDLRGFSLPIALACAGIMLPALQLIPLPPSLWQSLPGRDIIERIDQAAGLGPIWRPLTMAPPETMAALSAALTPLAVLLLAVQLDGERHRRILSLTLFAGGVSAIIGLMQLLGDAEGSLYLYASTNNGSAVGLFANRNHQAVALACLIPLTFAAAKLSMNGASQGATGSRDDAAFERPSRRRQRTEWPMPMAITATCFLVPLVFVTGSRSGLMMTLVALASLPFVLAGTATPRKRAPAMPASVWLKVAALVVIAVVGITIWLGRDVALDRLLASTPTDDLRLQMLPTLVGIAKEQWIWGSGLGSFERVYQIHEPARLLMAQYVNHAHNDWLELLITGGLPAAILAGIALAAVAVRAWQITFTKAHDPWQPLRRGALISIVVLCLASISDYPLRTPYLAAFMALCAAWLFLPARRLP